MQDWRRTTQGMYAEVRFGMPADTGMFVLGRESSHHFMDAPGSMHSGEAILADGTRCHALVEHDDAGNVTDVALAVPCPDNGVPYRLFWTGTHRDRPLVSAKVGKPIRAIFPLRAFTY